MLAPYFRLGPNFISNHRKADKLIAGTHSTDKVNQEETTDKGIWFDLSMAKEPPNKHRLS